MKLYDEAMEEYNTYNPTTTLPKVTTSVSSNVLNYSSSAGNKTYISNKITLSDLLTTYGGNSDTVTYTITTNKGAQICSKASGVASSCKSSVSITGVKSYSFYVKATDVEFIVTTDKETQKVVMIDKLVEITKTDITNGNELEGAELEVIDEDGNTIDKWTSTKEPHKVKGLEEGKTYILKETTAPYGYEITEEIKFTVTTDKETQKIEMKDMPILKNVKVIKIDTETKEVIKEMLPNITNEIIKRLRILQPGNCVAFGSAFKIPVLIKLDMPDPRPSSSSCDISSVWFIEKK